MNVASRASGITFPKFLDVWLLARQPAGVEYNLKSSVGEEVGKCRVSCLSIRTSGVTQQGNQGRATVFFSFLKERHST